MPEDYARPHVAEGRLIRVLEDRRLSFAGYHLYYANRRQQNPAFALVIETLRYRPA